MYGIRTLRQRCCTPYFRRIDFLYCIRHVAKMTVSAPTYRLPEAQLVSIEYPGPVASTSSSTAAAVQTLGGHERLTRTLSKPDGVVELNFRPSDSFSHPVGGETVDAGNVAVLKIVKRRRRDGRKKTKIVGEELVDESGIFTVECVGRVSKSVRFIGKKQPVEARKFRLKARVGSGMADLQYAPSGAHSDPTVKLADAMRNMDCE